MPSIALVEENPNSQLVSFKIDADYLGGKIGKLVFTRNGTLKQYSWLAQNLFKGSVTRVDFSYSEGNTYISLSKKLGTWSDAEKSNVHAYLAKAFGQPIAPVDVAAITANAEMRTAFKSNEPIKQVITDVFNEQVGPALAQHGGAMELTNISIDPSGKIQIETAMIGSCGDCSTAAGTTLKNAHRDVSATIDKIKKQHPDNTQLQSYEVLPIQSVATQELVYAR